MKTFTQYIISVFLILNCILYSQTETIKLKSDTSGYLESQNTFSPNFTQNDEVLTNFDEEGGEVIPTVKGELNVNAQGALTYAIPIEVFKGVNNFQPNLAIAYSSDSGNGQAGYGWNIVGLSSITQGGKSKRIDGVYEGPQFDGNDPFYIDGQRLIQVGTSNTYQTERFSHIKVTKINSGGYTFRVQYPDGKVAKYKQLVTGQHSIALMIDSFGNEIKYNYSVSERTPYITSIQYGKTTGSHAFTVSFITKNRQQPVRVWRNGLSYTNRRVLSQIRVSSTQEGLYRKYFLTHDRTSLGQERLRHLDVENGNGDKLKRLELSYNTADGRDIIFVKDKHNPGVPNDTEKIGGVAMGDFYGDGNITSVYWVNKGNNARTYLINSSRGVIDSNFGNSHYQPSLYTGKILKSNQKISERDQIIEFHSQVLDTDIYEDGMYFPKVKVIIKSRDLKNNQRYEADFYIRGTYEDFEDCDDEEEYCHEYLNRFKRDGNRIVSDFNKDGLVDILISQPETQGSFTANPDGVNDLVEAAPRAVLIEIGKYLKDGGSLNSIVFDGEEIPAGDLIEFDGDGISEILEVNKDTKKINVYKLNFSSNTITKPLSDFSLTSDVEKETPLIYGDFNGDGLTDFLTPKKVFKMDKDEGITATDMINDIETSPLIWHQYINRGTTFSKRTRDFTDAKLAYCTPGSSYHHIQIHRSSFWKKLWAGVPDRAEYINSDFGACTVIPVDMNNDGKTDLATFKKFGKIKFNGEKMMNATELDNFNVSGNQTTVFDQDLYEQCVGSCSSTQCEDDCIDDAYVTVTTPNTQIANTVVFHENKYDSNYEFSFITHDDEESIHLDNLKISPYSFFINSQKSNGLDSYENKLTLYDPYTKKNHEISIKSDNFRENQLQEIDNNSGVVQKIEYTSLQKMVGLNINYFYKYVPGRFNAVYPFYIHKQVPLKFLVGRVTTAWNESGEDKSLTKEYRYENAIQHLDGFGFMGFQKTYSSDVYESKLRAGKYLPKNIHDAIFWTVNTYDPTQENQLVKTTYGGLGNAFLTESTMTYRKINKSNNRYLYVSESETSKDNLKDITVTKTHQYNNDLLLTSTQTTTGTVGTSTSTFHYKSPWSSGEHFYHGRILKTEQSINAYGDTFTTKDEYSNFSNAGVPLTHKKYGHGTDAITTNTTYDGFGNKLTETVSANGVQPLSTAYEYDTTKRFVTKVTDPEGLEATSVVNVHGWVEEETSALGLTTTHTYDNWGNPLTSTDYLGVTTTLEKEQHSNGVYSLSTTTPNTPQTIVYFDRFDRQFKTKTQSINDKWVVTEAQYDIYGKKVKVSEPYFEGESATLWNETIYDELDRPIENIMYNGKVVTTCYEGLTVSVEDGDQKHTKTLDALGNVVYHKDHGGEIEYTYYAIGTLKEADYDGIKIKVKQDGWGNKIELDDPSAGIYKYEYDALGRKLKEITPKGETTYLYDDFGKLLYETTTGDYTNLSLQYEYDSETKLPKKIIGHNGSDQFTYETHYDNYYRINKKVEIHPEFTYTSETTFDDSNNGRPDVVKNVTTVDNKTATTYVKNKYEADSGILIALHQSNTSGAFGQKLWEIDEVNAKGQTLQSQLGNGYQINHTYNQYYLPEEVIHENHTIGQTALNIEYNFDVEKGLLLGRNNKVFNKNETFEYDILYRLKKEILNGNVQNQYTYDKRGRITHSTAIGKYEYNSNNYQFTSLGLNTKGKQLKDNRGFANIKYNSYKKAVSIHLAGKERINFDYNVFKDRAAMYYGSEAEDKYARPYRKYYSSDKAVEIKHNVQTGTIEIFTYFDGDPYSASVMQKNVFHGNGGQAQSVLYLHRDYQATILAISDVNGTIVEKRYFDAWGNLKQAWNNIFGNTTKLLYSNRGYTGHEHLQGVGLIHMNGRLYDAELRRFLSPDNFVQDPYNTQNYNRYQYAYNNPLMYTDPSGEFFFGGLLIGVAVSLVTKAISNISSGQPIWYGFGKSAVTGAVSSAITMGIGDAAKGIFGIGFSVGKALFQAGAHGITSGTLSAIEDGDFGSGFASAAISSLISSGVEGLGSIQFGDRTARIFNVGKYLHKDAITAIQIAAGGLSGGISSTIAGGNFWKGVRQGIIISGLNHAAHNNNFVRRWRFKHDLKSEMRKVGIRPMRRTSINTPEKMFMTLEDFVRKIASVRFWFEKAGSPEIRKMGFWNKRQYRKDGAEINASTPVIDKLDGDTGKYSFSLTDGKITFNKGAFDTNFKLAVTFMHELYHVYDFNNLRFNNSYYGALNRGMNHSAAISEAKRIFENSAYTAINIYYGADYSGKPNQ